MAEVKWIKIVTDIFDDEKMLLIESLPAHDSIIVVWFKLLCLAGKNNNSGVFMLNNRIPYTEEMLATIFRRDVNTVKLALRTFEEFGMIEIINGAITIPNWDKHQSLDAYERRKERDRIYQRARREKQKKLANGEKSSEASADGITTPSSDVASLEEDKIRIDKDKDKKQEKKESGSSGSGKEFNIYTYFQQRGFVSISPLMYEDIKTLVDMYSHEEVKQAVDIADENGIHKLTYVKGVLERRRAGDTKKPNNKNKGSNFSNFEGRDYSQKDYDDLERRLLGWDNDV